MKAKLISQWGSTRGTEHGIAGEATIGRAEDNSICVGARPVSSHHARVFFNGDRGLYYVEDLGSLNGTELDGMRITRAEPLGRLHVLRFGGVAEFLFVELDRTPAFDGSEPSPTKVPSAADATDQTHVDAKLPELPEALRTDTAPPQPPEEDGGE